MKLYFTRHGETEWNAANKVCGVSDVALTEKGLAQAKVLACIALEKDIDIIITSPLQRALTTANIVAEKMNKLVIIDRRLTEWDYGKFEGLDRSSDVYQQFQKGKQAFGVRLGKTGESLLQLAHRVYAALDEIIASYPKQNVMIASHGGVCRVIETYFSDMTREEFDSYFLKNCELKCHEVYGGMDKQTVIRHIDNGANFYLRLLGDAKHMDFTDNGVYSVIRPKSGEHGVCFVFDVRLEQLSEDVAKEKIAEIKTLHMPVWWSMCSSERVLDLLQGEPVPKSQPEPNDGEAYMAILPFEQPNYAASDVKIKRVHSIEDFGLWADMTNQILHGGFPDIHCENHFHLCEKGLLIPYIGYEGKTPVTVAAIIDNNGGSSLEFVGTLEEYRHHGFAKAVCACAIDKAFTNGSKIITARAFPEAKRMYESLGFKYY
ncbi:hypothetical protein FACS1894217_04030 [Clostridia bacterium]|nr:hypothetical protein FACS1894217_04030 [Clostridia bacterium]